MSSLKQSMGVVDLDSVCARATGQDVAAVTPTLPIREGAAAPIRCGQSALG